VELNQQQQTSSIRTVTNQQQQTSSNSAFRLQKLNPMNCNLKLLKARIEISPKNPHRKKEREYLFLEEEKNSEGGGISYVIFG
jgi:hypothetical protein